MRLKSREAGIPGGFQFLQPETAWEAPKHASFAVVVKELTKHRNGNPALAAKHNWSLDYETVANEVEYFNAVRLSKNPKYGHFIVHDGALDPKFRPPRLQPKEKPVAAVVGNFRKIAAGVGILKDWLGSGGRPVPQEQAEARAGVCERCPENQPGNLADLFVEAVSDKIHRQLEIKHEMQLRTSHDEKLKMCKACKCPLELKVWTPIEHILEHTTDEVKQRLDPGCWVLAEAAAAKT